MYIRVKTHRPYLNRQSSDRFPPRDARPIITIQRGSRENHVVAHSYGSADPDGRSHADSSTLFKKKSGVRRRLRLKKHVA